MMNILLVEDEPLILRSLSCTIEAFQQNYQIAGSAYNGQEAIDLLSEKGNQIDVVITDIHIPVVDGLELIEHINQHYPHILCMILTGFSEFSYAKRAIQQFFNPARSPVFIVCFITSLKQLRFIFS